MDRAPNQLDKHAIEFFAILEQFDSNHASIVGYVSILAAPERSTKDVDVKSR